MKTKQNVMLVCLLGALLLPTAARADFTYATTNGQVTVTGYSGTPPSALVIPDTINGLPVISIGDYAFKDSGLTSVTIPNSVTSIGFEAFEECYGLTSVTIGNGVTNIGRNAFDSCSSLTSVTVPNSVTSIGTSSFDGCFGLTNVTIGNGVTSIGSIAFGVCSNLTSVTIPSSVTNIDFHAFEYCSGLTAAYFRGNLPTLGYPDVFNADPNLTIYYQVGTTGWGGDVFGGYLPVPFYMVINGGFDDTGDFAGWTVSGNGSSQITGPNVYSGPYAAVFNETGPVVSGNKIISPGTSSLLSQTLPTQAGKSYLLSFAINGVSNGYGSVSWDGNTLVQQVFNPGWIKFQYVVTASSANTVLQFTLAASLGNNPGTIAVDSVSVLPLPQIAAQRISGGQVQLSAFTGTIGANYALDRAASLISPINWVQQATVPSDALGNATFTTTPSATGNNFWRMRSVP